MNVRRALIGAGAIAALYLAMLVWVDSRNHVFAELLRLLPLLPALSGLALLSYGLRYLRWRWLLGRVGLNTNWTAGFLAYMAGFAFTATPGKVGELVRIRYLAPHGVPSARVISAFVYERAFDLIVILLLSALAIKRTDVFFLVLTFVFMFLGAVLAFALHPQWLTRVAAYLRRRRLKRLARICQTLRDGVAGARAWATPLDAAVALVLGLAAWGLTAFAFVCLLMGLGVSLPFFQALAIYPLAMLAGAASSLPGGVGSTEVTIVLLLSLSGAPTATGTLAAVGIRCATLWFAIVCGFIALAVLEFARPGRCERQ